MDGQVVDGTERKCVCGAKIIFGLCADKDFGVEHEMPVCDEFMALDPVSFMLWVTRTLTQRLLISAHVELVKAKNIIAGPLS